MAVICEACFATSDGASENCATCGGPLTASATTPRIVGSRYEILRSLGEGAMGRVYEAHDLVLDETVALKFLRSDILAAPDLARRFRSEIKLARQVSHRNVCRIYEYGEEGDRRYISMELVEGQDVRHLVGSRPLRWTEAYDIAIQAAEGLQAIHEVGIIHRDLKPANLTRDVHGVVKLMDFGLAKRWETEEVKGITGTGQVVGTPEYMSPEQVRGRKVDFRSDLYALGVVVFELFTGDVPFRGETPIATLFKQVQDPPPLDDEKAAGIPEPLREVLRTALAKDPDERFATAHEMVEALRRARDATPLEPVASLAAPGGGSAPSVDTGSVPTRLVPGLARLPATGERAGHRGPDPQLLVPPLLTALRHADKDIRVGGARALGQIGPEAAIALSSLVKALKDPSWEVRTQACHALRKIGPAANGAVEPLLEASRDEDERVRNAAKRALASLAEPPTAAPTLPLQASPAAATPRLHETPRADARAPTPRKAGPVSFAFARPSIDGGLGKWAALAVVAAALVAGAFFWRPSTLSRRVSSSPAAVPAAAATPATPGAATQAIARIRELEGRMASMEEERERLEQAAKLRAAQAAAAPKGPTPDLAAARAAETELRKRLERELEQQRADLDRERKAFDALQAEAAAPPPRTVPAAPPPNTAPPAAPEPAAAVVPKVEPGTLVRLSDPRVVAPRATATPAPPYSLMAERLGLQGTVRLQLLVDERGDVVEAEPVSGARQLSQSAIRHVLKQWKFRPATLDGVPVKVRVAVSIRFEMR